MKTRTSPTAPASLDLSRGGGEVIDPVRRIPRRTRPLPLAGSWLTWSGLGVDDGIASIDEEIDEDEDRCGRQDEHLETAKPSPRFELSFSASPIPPKENTRSAEDGAGQQSAHLQADRRDDRKQRIADDAESDDLVGQALTGGSNEVPVEQLPGPRRG